MLTLTYGRKKPEDGDRGSVFFDALEDNIVLDDAHTHNGSNSARLTSSSSTAVTQAIASGSWSAIGSGYRQLVTCPGVITYDTHATTFRNDADGAVLYLTTERVSSTSYYVYINDNTLDLTVLYT